MRFASCAFLLVLAACACCSPPLDVAHRELQAIMADYTTASQVEIQYCAVHKSCDAVRTAQYNAAAALTAAESDPTDSSLRAARERVDAFLATERVP